MKYVFNTLPDTAEVSEFTFNPLTRAQEHDWPLFLVKVIHIGDGDEWVITYFNKCLVQADYPEINWTRVYRKNLHNFHLKDALAVAEEIIWRIRVNGKTAAQVIREFYPELEIRIL